jgi:hypothetical protein
MLMNGETPAWQLITFRRAMIVIGVAYAPLILLGFLFPAAVEVVMPYRRFVVMALAFTLVWTLLFRDVGRWARAAWEADGDKAPWGWGRIILALVLVGVGVGGTMSLLFWPR